MARKQWKFHPGTEIISSFTTAELYDADGMITVYDSSILTFIFIVD